MEGRVGVPEDLLVAATVKIWRIMCICEKL
jgi:hypothetical protein